MSDAALGARIAEALTGRKSRMKLVYLKRHAMGHLSFDDLDAFDKDSKPLSL